MPCPSPGDLPDPEIKPTSLTSPAWACGFFTTSATWEALCCTVSVPGSSTGKKSACNAGIPGLVPGSGRSPGEGTVSPLHYSWASLVAQVVKNPPALWDTRVPSLDWKDTLEEGMATHSSILTGESRWTEELGGLQPMGSQRVRYD